MGLFHDLLRPLDVYVRDIWHFGLHYLPWFQQSEKGGPHPLPTCASYFSSRINLFSSKNIFSLIVGLVVLFSSFFKLGILSHITLLLIPISLL